MQNAWRAPPTTSGPKGFDHRASLHFRSLPKPPASAKSVANLRAVEPDWGIYRDDKIPMKNCLSLDRIEKGASIAGVPRTCRADAVAGLDVRTTLMIKNIPTRMTDVALMAYIDDVRTLLSPSGGARC